MSNIVYQSHHTGIETRINKPSYFWKGTTNRTTLELKLTSAVDQVERLILPIAPHWN